MGTRGIMGFVVDGQEKLTYNHYDSSPDGLGLDVLRWLRGLNEDTLPQARADAAKLVMITDEEASPTPAQIAVLGRYADPSVGAQGITNTEVQTWYQLLRNTQGNPAEALIAGFMIDSATFALDSLFCEYGYVIDFDTSELEAYVGFRKEPPTEGRWATPEALGAESEAYAAQAERYPHMNDPDRRYYAIQRVAAWPLLEGLPDDDTFMAAFATAIEEVDACFAPQAWTAASTAVESIEEQIVKEALAALRCGAGRAAAEKILRQGFLTTERLCHTEAPAEQVL